MGWKLSLQKVTNNPKRTILIYFIVLIIAALGILRLKTAQNNDIADLFTPEVNCIFEFRLQNGENRKEAEIYSSYFKANDDQLQVIAVPNSLSGLFNTEAWLELLEVENKIDSIDVDGVKVSGKRGVFY